MVFETFIPSFSHPLYYCESPFVRTHDHVSNQFNLEKQEQQYILALADPSRTPRVKIIRLLKSFGIALRGCFLGTSRKRLVWSKGLETMFRAVLAQR